MWAGMRNIYSLCKGDVTMIIQVIPHGCNIRFRKGAIQKYIFKARGHCEER